MGIKQRILCFVFTFIFMTLVLPNITGQTDITPAKLEHGVMLYTKKNTNSAPWLWQELEKLLHIVLTGNTTELPFNKSIALLVGVSSYTHLQPQLPFARNDVEAMKNYLLGAGGFDEVYVVIDKVATPELIRQYILNRFRGLSHKDRLLFYYSGHGTDLGSDTGYMQFSGAKKDDYVTDYLAISDCLQWSRILDVRHLLFIFDCCASGLAFSSNMSINPLDVAATLSGNGSRNVLTAGTAYQKVYGDGQNAGSGELHQYYDS